MKDAFNSSKCLPAPYEGINLANGLLFILSSFSDGIYVDPCAVERLSHSMQNASMFVTGLLFWFRGRGKTEAPDQ